MLYKEIPIEFETIYKFLNRVDSYFKPAPLSTKTDLKEYAEKLHSNALHFSCWDSSELVGLSCCYMNNPNRVKAFISLICIDPNYFKKGIGKVLITLCELKAKELQFDIIEAEVDIENIPSFLLFKSNGYKIHHTKENSHFMQKGLLAND